MDHKENNRHSNNRESICRTNNCPFREQGNNDKKPDKRKYIYGIHLKVVVRIRIQGI